MAVNAYSVGCIDDERVIKEIGNYLGTNVKKAKNEINNKYFSLTINYEWYETAARTVFADLYIRRIF